MFCLCMLASVLDCLSIPPLTATVGSSLMCEQQPKMLYVLEDESLHSKQQIRLCTCKRTHTDTSHSSTFSKNH